MFSNRTGRAPTLIAILACDLIVRDEQTHNLSLIGIFNVIHAANFPFVYPRLHVFVSLTDGRGACKGELRLVDRETDQVLAGAVGHIEFPPDARAVVDMNLELRNVLFPKPGSYAFDFYAEGEMIGSRPFSVVQVSKPPPAAGGTA